jgi:hypothetical protein
LQFKCGVSRRKPIGAHKTAPVFPTQKSVIYKGKSRYSLQARANTVRPYKFRGYAGKPQFVSFMHSYKKYSKGGEQGVYYRR